MELLLEKEMEELINRNQKFMSKLIKENRYLQNEIKVCKDNLQRLENINKTNKYNIDKLEKEKLILVEERKMFDLKLKISEETLLKAEERIINLEKEIEKLEMEVYSLMANKDLGNTNKQSKYYLTSKSSEVTICLDKIKELIINGKYNEAEELLNNNSELIITSESDFSEEDIILIIYLAFYNNLLDDFIKRNNEIFVYYNSTNYEAKALNILRREGYLKLGDTIDECYQSYIDSKENIFSNINPMIKKYILSVNLDYSYKYFDKVSVVQTLLFKNKYKNVKCFVKEKNKYYLVNAFEKIDSNDNKEVYMKKEEAEKYLLDLDREVNSKNIIVGSEKNSVGSKSFKNTYDTIVNLYSKGELPEVKNYIDKILDKPLEIEKLTLDKINSILFMGNITGVDKYKMERVLKVNTLETSFENIAYRKISNKKEAYKYLRDNRDNFKNLDSKIKEKLLNELTELQMRRERLGDKYFNEYNTSSQKKEQVALNDESELKKLGYNTNLKLEERWNILINKAIPKLGQRKVVWYLRMFIKINRHRKDRLSAVQKWEKDLEKVLKL